jgi:predicted regulator of Ras-like GTPase activity (Roadblock/LC7/MglB family)/FixJ family two-component response regulator
MKNSLIFLSSRTEGEVLRLSLEDHGVTGKLIQNREELFAQSLRYIPDLIFLDLILPNCSSFELCRLLKSKLRNQYIPIILCYSEEINVNQFDNMEDVFDAHLTKPFTQKKISFLLEQWKELKFKENNYQNSQNSVNDINKDINMVDSSSLKKQLQNFVSSDSDVEGAALVSPDGLSITSVLSNDMDEEQIAAISAVMLSMGEHIGSELVRGTTGRILIEGEKGYSILLNLNEDVLLIVFAKKEAKQGLIFLNIKRLVGELIPLLA